MRNHKRGVIIARQKHITPYCDLLFGGRIVAAMRPSFYVIDPIISFSMFKFNSSLSTEFSKNPRFIRDAQYLYGVFTVTNVTSQLSRIQDFLSKVETNNYHTAFDVIISGSGIFRLSGYIYAGKNYGSGIFMGHDSIGKWVRSNNVDSFDLL